MLNHIVRAINENGDAQSYRFATYDEAWQKALSLRAEMPHASINMWSLEKHRSDFYRLPVAPFLHLPEGRCDVEIDWDDRRARISLNGVPHSAGRIAMQWNHRVGLEARECMAEFDEPDLSHASWEALEKLVGDVLEDWQINQLEEDKEIGWRPSYLRTY